MRSTIKEILSDIGSLAVAGGFLSLLAFLPFWLWLAALIAVALLLIHRQNLRQEIRHRSKECMRRSEGPRHTGTGMDW
jgi:hypothetical protein